jgi:hypothetical protein
MVDGAVSRSQNTGAVGVICRDHEGLYLGATVCIYPGIIDPAILETIACREALNFVGIYPRINHMKLNEHTWRLLFIAKHAYRTL